MHKALTLTLLVATSIATFAAVPAFEVSGESVEIEISNPCTRTIGYGYNSHDLRPELNVDNYGSVDAGKSKKIFVPKGAYIKFSRKGGGCNTIAGKAEYKGQMIRLDCM